MQVFIPYKNVIEIAKAMYKDILRYNKQCIETVQIIQTIEGADSWKNHPVVLMYKDHKDWLVCYVKCLTSFRDYMKTKDKNFLNQAIIWSKNAELCKPDFITDELCNQHKRRLFSKNPTHYPQFASYGTSEENWYFVNGEIVKYINGKRVK